MTDKHAAILADVNVAGGLSAGLHGEYGFHVARLSATHTLERCRSLA